MRFIFFIFSILAIPLIQTAQSVSASNDWSIILCEDGTVQTFGRNDHGQLGNGTFMESPVPVEVIELTNIVAVSAGLDHGLALTDQGVIWGWGDNIHGQLGNGSFVDLTQPVEMETLDSVVAISTGANHSMAITADGKMWVWGQNNHGQLGVEGITNSALPIELTILSNVVSVSGGGNHSMAATSDGKCWSWGNNSWGELGDGSNDDNHEPQLFETSSPVIEVAAGNGFSLCLTENGQVWAWGKNEDGQLANGTFDDSHNPGQVSIDNVKYLAQGSMAELSMVRKHDGTVWAWGNNEYGAYGNGIVGDQNAITAVPELNNSLEMSVGSEHSLTLYDDETVHVAGLNGWGQLGLGTFTDSPTAMVNDVVCSAFVGVEETESNDLLIFPNPTNGQFSIQSRHAIDRIRMINSTGDLVFEKWNPQLFTFNLDLAEGIYFVQLFANNAVQSGKFVVKE